MLSQTFFLLLNDLADGFNDYLKPASSQDYWKMPLLAGVKSNQGDTRDEDVYRQEKPCFW